ncbi:uncharacterized protein EDB93DRAFT_633881 [Suillus bovinus]|uniref:uncharacterized protein n=1 Tax=Suillus bovinus TaxID=48563 RepID=UPI001B86F846|nr:uncharacterized protein EDB93DRAFT_633881 [Suillus bovinus]KAG2141408.1 hypothetical protein EDB93DRAFT_633881 [Suillus bovinus]
MSVIVTVTTYWLLILLPFKYLSNPCLFRHSQLAYHLPGVCSLRGCSTHVHRDHSYCCPAYPLRPAVSYNNLCSVSALSDTRLTPCASCYRICKLHEYTQLCWHGTKLHVDIDTVTVQPGPGQLLSSQQRLLHQLLTLTFF